MALTTVLHTNVLHCDNQNINDVKQTEFPYQNRASAARRPIRTAQTLPSFVEVQSRAHGAMGCNWPIYISLSASRDGR